MKAAGASVVRKVLVIAAGVTGDDPADLHAEMSLFSDLGLDSAAALELIVELEDAFDISIGSEDATDLKTLGDVAALVARLSRSPKRSTTG